MFKHNFDKLFIGPSWSTRFKQCNFVKVQIPNSLKIKSSKAKAKGTKLKHHVPRQVRVRVGFSKIYQF